MTEPIPPGLAEAMSGTRMMEGVPIDAIRELVGLGTIRRYRRSTYLFHQGEESSDVHFLFEGRLEVSSLSATGQRILHSTLERPEFLGELGVFGDMPRTATTLALEDTAVWAATGDRFMTFLIARPQAMRNLLRALARQVHAHEVLVEDLLFLDLKGRVAKRLLQLVSPSLSDLPANGAVVPSVVTHADLASLAGGSRENVTRILSELQRRRLIVRDGRRYRLTDISGLCRLAGI